MTEKNDLFSGLVSKSLVQLVKKESNVSAKEIIEDIEDSNNEADIDKDKLPATAEAVLYKNKKYKGHLKKYVKKAKKYSGGLKKFQELKKENKKSNEK